MEIKDLQFVKDSLAELGFALGGKQPDDTYRTALVIVSALTCGTDAERSARFNKLPVEFVQAIRRRMIAAELWTDMDVHCDHWFAGSNQVSSSAGSADLLVAEGLVVRAWDEASGDHRYRLLECAPPAAGHRLLPIETARFSLGKVDTLTRANTLLIQNLDHL